MNRVNKIINNVLLLFGTIIGGGLATGKELSAFFCCFGNKFYLPCILCVLFLIIVLFLISYIDFTKANGFSTFAFFMFRLTIAATMLSALRSITMLIPNSNTVYIILLIISYILMFCDFKLISRFFNIIVPIIFLGLIFISIFNLNSHVHIVESSNNIISMVIGSISYASFNLFLTAFLIKQSFEKSTKKERILSILVFSVLFGFMLIIMCYALLSNNCINAQIPMLELVQNKAYYYKGIVITIVILAIISTFIAIHYELIKTTNRILKNDFVANSSLFSLCLILSCFGVDNLINYGYKAFGIFAFVFFLVKALYAKRLKCMKMN